MRLRRRLHERAPPERVWFHAQSEYYGQRAREADQWLERGDRADGSDTADLEPADPRGRRIRHARLHQRRPAGRRTAARQPDGRELLLWHHPDGASRALPRGWRPAGTDLPGSQNRILTIEEGRFTICRVGLAPPRISTPGHRLPERSQCRALPAGSLSDSTSTGAGESILQVVEMRDTAIGGYHIYAIAHDLAHSPGHFVKDLSPDRGVLSLSHGRLTWKFGFFVGLGSRRASLVVGASGPFTARAVSM